MVVALSRPAQPQRDAGLDVGHKPPSYLVMELTATVSAPTRKLSAGQALSCTTLSTVTSVEALPDDSGSGSLSDLIVTLETSTDMSRSWYVE